MTEALRMARGRVAAAGTGLRLDDVSVTYRTGLTAIEDVSFAIPRATITALVGVNGSGKSTLFKAIMGFVPVASGSVEILDRPARGGAGRQPRRLRAAGRGGRLELSGAGRGRGDDGPLRPHGLAAPAVGRATARSSRPRSPGSA